MRRATRRIAPFDRLRYHLATADALPQMAALGLLAGLLTGVLVLLFRVFVQLPLELMLPLHKSENFEGLSVLARVALTGGGAVVLGIALQRLPPRDRAVGVVHVLERLHRHQGHLPLRNATVQFFAGGAALITGQSGGREGPAIHLGAAVSSLLGQYFALPNNSISPPGRMRHRRRCRVIQHTARRRRLRDGGSHDGIQHVQLHSDHARVRILHAVGPGSFRRSHRVRCPRRHPHAFAGGTAIHRPGKVWSLRPARRPSPAARDSAARYLCATVAAHRTGGLHHRRRREFCAASHGHRLRLGRARPRQQSWNTDWRTCPRLPTPNAVDAALVENPVWIVVEDGAGPSCVLAAADLRRLIDAHQHEQHSTGAAKPINLLEIPGRRMDVATIDLQATIHEAWAQLTKHDAEALCVQRAAPDARNGRSLGVITRTDILRVAGFEG